MSKSEADNTLLAWSGGKDSVMAAAALDQLDGLVTTVAASTGRTGIHGLRPAVVVRQAAAMGVPIEFVEIPGDGSNDEYEAALQEAMSDAHRKGVNRMAYGDIELEEVRSYREDVLADIPIEIEWPLWGQEPESVTRSCLKNGYRPLIVAIDLDRLPPAILGRELTVELLESLPESVDPAGEDGSFHTLIVDGPIFEQPLSIRRGPRVTKEFPEGRYQYLDILPEPVDH